MRTKRKIAIRLILFAILFTMTAWIPAAVEPAWADTSIPGLNAKVTKNNILKILNKYDKDGAYILNKQIAAGDDILQWFSKGNQISSSIDLAIHEETHQYLYSYAKKKRYAYFIGKKKTVYVPYTTVFPSKKMARSIPKALRTFRYNIYVAKPTKRLTSNVDGAYGLLDEFMAYRSGMNNTVSLYPYYVAQGADWDVWEEFINNCENDRMAYAEFKYYILHYLYYAKTHNKKVYKGILNNKQFCKAYRNLESNYAKHIADYEGDLEKIKNYLEKKGYWVEITDDSVGIYTSDGSGTGIGRFTSDYNMLQKELKKSRYKTLHRQLVKNGK